MAPHVAPKQSSRHVYTMRILLAKLRCRYGFQQVLSASIEWTTPAPKHPRPKSYQISPSHPYL